MANTQTSVPVFTAGQVLTAAQQNQINTGIPVFADSTARDAAFGGTGEKTLAEGQFAYLEDSNTTQYYDGASWVAVGASGLTFIAGGSFTASSAVNVNSCFSATYLNYKIIVQGSHSSASAVAINMRMRVSGADNTTSNYFYSYNTVDASSTEVNVGAGSQTLFIAGLWGDGSGMLDMTITNPNTAARFNFVSLFASAGSTFGLTGRNAGTFNAATAFDGFSLIPASGTMTGTYRVYGLADA
jgi:hypothetical protein